MLLSASSSSFVYIGYIQPRAVVHPNGQILVVIIPYFLKF